MIILYIGILLIIYSMFSGELTRNYKPTIGFMFIFFIMAFQSNVQGDYMSYMEDFGMGYSRTMNTEPLWVLLQKPFYSFGWKYFIFFMVLFQIWVVCRISKLYASNHYQYLGAILFFFTFGMMLIQMKALRQGLAIEICLLPFIMKFENKNRLLNCILHCYGPVVIAYLIHNSAIVGLLPATALFMMYQKSWFQKTKNSYKGEWFVPTVITIIFCVLYLFKHSVFSELFTKLSTIVTMNDIRLGGYLLSDQENELFDISWLIVLYDAIMVFLSTWYYRYINGKGRILTLMAIISFFADMLFFGMGSLPRIGYFFVIANVIVIPCLASLISKRFGKLYTLLFIFLCLGYSIKTSLPFLLEMDNGGFGAYKFIFM